MCNDVSSQIRESIFGDVLLPAVGKTAGALDATKELSGFLPSNCTMSCFIGNTAQH